MYYYLVTILLLVEGGDGRLFWISCKVSFGQCWVYLHIGIWWSRYYIIMLCVLGLGAWLWLICYYYLFTRFWLLFVFAVCTHVDNIGSITCPTSLSCSKEWRTFFMAKNKLFLKTMIIYLVLLNWVKPGNIMRSIMIYVVNFVF